MGAMPVLLRLSTRTRDRLVSHRHLLKNQLQHRRSSSGKSTKPTETSIPVPNHIGPLPFWQRLGPLTRLASGYARAQKRRPYVTQLCSSLTIYFLGDLGAQWLSEDEEWDPKRTMRSLVIGGVSSIPSYKWFLFLSHNFNYSSHIVSLAIKIAINQSIFTPCFNTYFFGMQSLLSGDSLPAVWERVKATVPTSIVNSCKLWPAVTAFSFTFIPIEYRSVFAGVIAIGWQTYLAFLNRRAEQMEAMREEEAQELAVGSRLQRRHRRW